MILTEILTAWTGGGTLDNENRPEIGETYVLRKIEDVTGQPSDNIAPEPNVYIIRAWVDDAVFAQIEIDRPDDILWSEQL